MPCEHNEDGDVDTEKALAKGWARKEPSHIGGCTINLEVAEDETAESLKLALVQAALSRVMVATRSGPDSLNLYLAPKVRCVAFMGGAGGNRTYSMFLGDKLFDKSAKTTTAKISQIVGGMGQGVRGVADQLYDAQRKSTLNPTRWVISKQTYQAAKAHAKGEAVVVHELGHILHEGQHRAEFWAIKTNRGPGGGRGMDFVEPGEIVKPTHAPMRLANQVSQYAGTGIIEFVAEVFTGLVYGTRYSDEVIALYKQEGGPAMVLDPRTHP